MYVADIAIYEGIVPCQTICKLIGEAPNRRFYSTMLVTQLSIYFKVILVENPDELADVPVFHDEKIYNVRNFRKKLVEVKAAEPWAVGFWKSKFNFNVGKKNMAVELQLYPGDKAKVKVRKNKKWSYCTDTVDSIELFFYLFFFWCWMSNCI